MPGRDALRTLINSEPPRGYTIDLSSSWSYVKGICHSLTAKQPRGKGSYLPAENRDICRQKEAEGELSGSVRNFGC